jgi:hypothetical protein
LPRWSETMCRGHQTMKRKCPKNSLLREQSFHPLGSA